jgi:DNA-binding MarR family transcriptional regulator
MMSATRKSTPDAASEQLMFVSGYVYRLLRSKTRGLGIRWSGLMVLVDLDLLGPTDQRSLVEIEKMRGATMTVLLQDLEGRGWVERETHEADARVTRVRITASGRSELRRAGMLLRNHLKEELSGMPTSVLRDVAASLKPLSAALMKKATVATSGSARRSSATQIRTRAVEEHQRSRGRGRGA